jgi:hypothetical protein
MPVKKEMDRCEQRKMEDVASETDRQKERREDKE